MKQKVNILIILMALGVLASWYLYKNQDEGVFTEPLYEPKTTDSTFMGVLPKSGLDTSDWQMYRLESWGIEFKYPQGWWYTDSARESRVEISIKALPYDFAALLIGNSDSPQEQLEKYGGWLKKYTLDGQDVFKYNEYSYFIEHNDIWYQINGQEYALAILETLTFFEPTGNGEWVERLTRKNTPIDTSDWITYENTEDRFTLSHPPDWEPIAFSSGPLLFESDDLVAHLRIESRVNKFPPYPNTSDVYIDSVPASVSTGNRLNVIIQHNGNMHIIRNNAQNYFPSEEDKDIWEAVIKSIEFLE